MGIARYNKLTQKCLVLGNQVVLMDEQQDTILIVDDTPTNLDLVFKYLTRSGFKVLVSQDGMTAIKQAKHAQPDLILLDVMMPEMDGFETCQRLKEQEETKDIPVIFMTALVDVESKVKGFTVGAVDYVTKPFERREVLERINTHLTIRKLQQNLEAEVAERKKAEEALRTSLTELQTQNEELDAFAHTVAHNLKSPLTALTGIAQILATDFHDMPSEDVERYLNIVYRGGRKANNIVEELLVLASVRKIEVKASPLDMSYIVTEAKQRAATINLDNKPEFIVPSNWPVAMGYGPWVEEIWVNYISNAIKYGGTPPKIELGSNVEPNDKIRFWVKDNGPGLTPEEQARLFTPFTQLRRVRTEGHGLGLSIVRRIVEKLDGEADVTSKGIPGEGSVFSFTLPTPT